MSHQVLARKWRPRDFASLVGQDHVVRALTHALGSGRLHHAYLFTGTRGVGKTTLARILAKALNCETGVGATPCGVCRACTEIDAGRFVDYIEMDAASNRRVEEMTQVLENAVYAPSIGRYKVHVIDEVHMLSTHAFNAMLKTLEEPPPHVVFILATTDPQKVPVTVLSRCLQFGLKNMTPQAIARHLGYVLEQEQVAFEPAALDRIGRSAAGSMRDALSLLDQAIAYGGGRVEEQPVREMLGLVDAQFLVRLLESLIAGDGAAMVALADEMQAANAPFGRVLDDLAVLLQRVALAQVGVFADGEDHALLARLAGQLAAEDVQVFYQIAVHGARELPLAPDPHTGFTMSLLRLLAFRTDDQARAVPSAAVAPPPRAAQAIARPAAAAAPAAGGGAGPAMAALRAAAARPAAPARSAPPASAPAAPEAPAASAPRAAAPSGPARAPSVDDDRPDLAEAAAASGAPLRSFDGDWPALAAALPVGGLAQQFMQQSELVSHDGLAFNVRVPIRPLAEPGTQQKVRDALAAWFGAPVRLSVEIGAVGARTAASVNSRQQAERLAQAQAAVDADPFVQTLISDFGGRIVPDSVKPAEPG